MKFAAIATAVVCTGLVLLGQFFVVHRRYGDDWTALYHTGAYVGAPPVIENEQIYRFPDAGFDGQFYHFIAHDPWMRRGSAGFVDNPRLRWRRILLPALAWSCALGNSEFVDSAYFGAMLAFVFLGVYWLARYCERCGFTAWWGAAFLLVPAVLISLQRGTVDVALAALCMGFAVYAEDSRLVYPVLALAPLARETGVCLIAAFVAVRAWRREWRAAAIGSLMAAPLLAWMAFLHARTAADATVFASWIPLRGLVERTIHPLQFALTSSWLRKAAALDFLAVLGIWLALALAAASPDRKRGSLAFLRAAAIAFAAVAVFLAQPQAWAETYAFGRTLSPLLLFVALAAVARRRWIGLLPTLCVLPRILLQMLRGA